MGLKKYFRREFQKEMLTLEHDSGADFYISCWQRNRSALPLLFLRTIVFVGCAGTLIASMILTMRALGPGPWFIFLTHWGVLFNAVTAGLALYVSLAAIFQGPIDATLGLPWYVKAYWACHSIATPIAFFITLFYWTLLTSFASEYDYAIDPVLDVFIHGINSVFMLALLVIARHPTRLLHFYWSVCVGIIYLIFSLIFHFAGGESPFGTSWIYPMLNWDKPGQTVAVAVGSALGIIIMHCIATGITQIRNKLTERFRETNVLPISNEPR